MKAHLIKLSIKRERDNRCRRLKKLRKARDLASAYVTEDIRVSMLTKHFKFNQQDDYLFTGDLVKYIISKQRLILCIRPPKPVSQKR